MKKRSKTDAIARLLMSVGVLIGSSLPALAQDDYPSKVIRIIVPSNAGSGTDDSTRRLAKYLAESRGWHAVVQNLGGANGMIAAEEFTHTATDGYTLFAGGTSAMTYSPVAYKDVRYDTVKDFTPVALSIVVPDTLVVPAKSPITSVADLVEKLRANPNKYFYASSGVNRVATELFLQNAHLSAVNVNYRSSPAALTDLIGGSINFMLVDSIAASPMIRSGLIRALAFTSKKRLNALPDVPTMTEAGYPGVVIYEWNGFFLRKDAPVEEVNKLHQAIVDYYKTPAAQKYIDTIGGQYEDITPGALKKWIADQLRENRAIYARAGIRPQ
ncbi:tripartite-type tricarboxylate transporter receptor subunit TctC [Paraburkholderia sp. BL6669N2]|uniref:Bug family tripartite tricarboxylate transporter substrate binding protein n=1 Tax=Paraburkholderia sp. BL6669N2 TaxID=1938807 RepID=UPI000E288DB0|nr:tripartite tricarboxylate transporter substrate binding protein [Paraburkholderia sp. BL6669N2]REG50981.1 tripartite-type tricarboxylate transporter receptor subunit TctC [Paraburkholderia sp. BL6669N2]